MVHAPHGIVANRMQTSLARRQRRRRIAAARRPRGGGGGAARVLLAIPIVLFAGLVATGLVGFVGTVSAYSYYSRDLPAPRALLENLSFDQQTVIVDRTGQIELAKLGERKREVVTFEELPAEVIDATTAIEDRTYWTNAGFDPLAILSAAADTLRGEGRGASTITQQLVRNRLLPASAFEGSVYDRKIREIIQSIRLTQEYPGEEGKREIITAYLNQNFYGNQSYGVKAASLSYFGKELKDLSLAQAAVLAAIPQSPTKFDLVRNAVKECTVEVPENGECPADKLQLVVPAASEIAQRRDRVLDLMKTRSVLSGHAHTLAEYEAAKTEKIVLVPQAARPWNAPHLVWKVREELSKILCGEDEAATCEKVDTGGYRVTTTLDWRMQQIAEKWTYAAARGPHASNPTQFLNDLGIPKASQSWIVGLKNSNIHNAASAIVDYRTGQVLAYVGSANYQAVGNEQFDPFVDVLADGQGRQPGSAIKPVNYAIGIDDRTLTAATMFMDVATDFGKKYVPTQADSLERGPVRLRSALQFSLNVPAIKSGLIMGLDHVLAREKEFGIELQPSAIPVVSMSIGTIEVHPIDLLSAYGVIANGGQLMSRQVILSVTDPSGRTIWPLASAPPTPTQVISPQAAYIVTDILSGNTRPDINPYWAEWQIKEGNNRRPAAYKTGTTSDNRDVHAYGYLAPPEDPKAPALAVGIWMGNSNSDPNKGSLSLDSSAPLWSAILNEASKGLPVADFKPPPGLVTAEVDAFSGLLPGPFTAATVKELFIEGTVPTRRDDLHAQVDIDTATGLRWQDGCAGPMQTKGYLDFSKAEPGFPQWQPYTQDWAARAARGAGTRKTIEPGKVVQTSYFYGGRFFPFGRTWGGAFAPTETCTPQPICSPDNGNGGGGGGGNPHDPPVIVIDPTFDPCLTPPPTESSTPSPTRTASPTPKRR
jgi:peptidoglycan glycosyltransferase